MKRTDKLILKSKVERQVQRTIDRTNHPCSKGNVAAKELPLMRLILVTATLRQWSIRIHLQTLGPNSMLRVVNGLMPKISLCRCLSFPRVPWTEGSIVWMAPLILKGLLSGYSLRRAQKLSGQPSMSNRPHSSSDTQVNRRIWETQSFKPKISKYYSSVQTSS